MPKHKSFIRNGWLVLAVIMMAGALIGSRTTTQSSERKAASKPPSVRMRNAYGNLPLSFEENRGQTDPRVKFLARGGGYALFLTSTQAVLKLRAASLSQSSAKHASAGKIVPAGFHPEPTKMSVVRIRLEGANADSQASGVDRLPGVNNYFIGKDPKKWRKNVPTFAGVKFAGIYPGIDLVYRGAQGRLEYDYVIAANADPSRIKMAIDGADALSIDRDGNLFIKTSVGEVMEKAPVIYQGTNNGRHPVKGGYALIGKNRVAFRLDGYDHSQPLTIDPLLSYTTYLGGSGDGMGDGDTGVAITVDSSGEAIVTGYTFSTDFPEQNGFQPVLYGESDVFITKFSADGSSLVYSTFAGGTDSDVPRGIAIDSTGDVYVTGVTQSPDYPVSIGAYQTSFTADPVTGGEGFVTALDPDGGLIYSTFLNEAAGEAIAVDSNDNAYVTGEVSGPSANNVYVAQLNSGGTELLALTSPVLAGVSAQGIALDGEDNVYVLTTLNSTSSVQTASVVKLAPALSSLLFSQPVFSGLCPSCFKVELQPSGIAVDSSGNFHVVGNETGYFGGAFGPEFFAEVFVQSYNSNGGLTGSFAISPNLDNQVYLVSTSLMLAPSGNIFVAGTVLQQVFVTTCSTEQCDSGAILSPGAVFLEFDSASNNIVYSTTLGALGDSGGGIAVDQFGNVFITGHVASGKLVVTNGAFQQQQKGGGNAFAARIAVTATPTPTATPTATPTPTVSPTATPTNTATATQTPPPRSPIPTRVPTPTPSITPTPTPSITATPTASATATTAATATQTPISTPVGTATGTIVATPAPTATATPTATPTPQPIGALHITPASINFGRVKAGASSAVRFVTVANPAKDKVSAMITDIGFRAGGNGFAIDQARTTCGATLAKGKICRVGITFTPPGVGAYSDNFMVTGNFTNSGQIVGLLGSGK
jgi:hypothetical protein